MPWLVPKVISGLLGKRWFTATGSGAERRNSQRQPSDEESVNLEWRDDEGEWRVEPADACDESKNGLGLLTEFRFRPGQVVYVLREEAKPLQASVCHARLAGESYHVGLAVIPRERRRVERTTATGEASLHWTSATGTPLSVRANVRNVSEGGIQVESGEPMDEGVVIRIRGSNVECLGSVRYCAPRGKTYYLGLQMIGEPLLADSTE